MRLAVLALQVVLRRLVAAVEDEAHHARVARVRAAAGEQLVAALGAVRAQQAAAGAPQAAVVVVGAVYLGAGLE